MKQFFLQCLLWLTTLSLCLNCPALPPDIVRSNWTGAYYEFQLVAFSADANFLAAGEYNDVDPEVMVLHTGDLSVLWHDDLRGRWGCFSIAFSVDNALVAFGVEHSSGVLFATESGNEIAGLSRANAVATSPQNPSVVVGAAVNGIERLGSPVFPNSSQVAPVSALVFETNGASFWLGNAAGIIQHWQLEPPQLLWQTNISNNAVSAINILPGGQKIITLSSNLDSYNEYYYWTDVRLWEVGHTNFLLHITPDFPVFSTTLTADGKYLLTPLKSWQDNDYDTNHLVFWRASDGREMVRYDEQLEGAQQVAVAPDGKTFAYGRSDGMVFIARMPLLIDSIRRTGNQTILQWQGGSGLYQLQSRTNLLLGSWQNVSPATTNTIATNVSSSTLFFRVQSLPQP